MSQSNIAKNPLLFERRTSGVRRETDLVRSHEEQLVARLCNGDKTAFDEIYDKYNALAHGILLARIPADDVEDVVQEVFITVFRKIETLKDPNAIGSWIASIARHAAIDHLRSRVQTEEIPDEIGGQDVRDDEVREILAAIKNLPDAYSETLILRLVEGMTGPEIARMTGLKPDSVRVNLHRGMKMLRKRLGAG